VIFVIPSYADVIDASVIVAMILMGFVANRNAKKILDDLNQVRPDVWKKLGSPTNLTDTSLSVQFWMMRRRYSSLGNDNLTWLGDRALGYNVFLLLLVVFFWFLPHAKWFGGTNP